MKHRWSWMLGGMLMLANGPAAGEPPNIVFIITDDQPTSQLGFLGGEVLTPNIDRLATGGIQFERAYVSASVCSPSRYTCLSGQHASRCRIPFFTDQSTAEGVTKVLWNVGFADDQVTLPKALQRGGYTTGFVGKWHINGPPRWTLLPPGSDPADPAVKAILADNQAAASEGIRGHGFDYAERVYQGNPNDDQALVHAGLNGHNMEWVTEGALAFIEANRDRPFYLYFSPTLVHVPPPLESLQGDPRRSPVGMLDGPITGVQPSRDNVMQRCREAGIDPAKWGATWLDDGIGAVMDKVRDLGLAEKTLFVFFVDHGMATASKGTCYEGGLVSPTVAYWPGTIQPARTQAMIQNTDFAPTLLEVAGIAPPADMVVDGKSFAPLFRGEPFAGHPAVYSEIGLVRAVSTPTWKYLTFRVPPSLERTLPERMAEHQAELALEREKWPEAMTRELDPEARYYQMGMAPGGSRFERGQMKGDAPWVKNYFDTDQLYDLVRDPTESKNLADDPAYADKLAEMQDLLRGYLRDLPGTYPGLKP